MKLMNLSVQWCNYFWEMAMSNILLLHVPSVWIFYLLPTSSLSACLKKKLNYIVSMRTFFNATATRLIWKFAWKISLFNNFGDIDHTMTFFITTKSRIPKFRRIFSIFHNTKNTNNKINMLSWMLHENWVASIPTVATASSLWERERWVSPLIFFIC